MPLFARFWVYRPVTQLFRLTGRFAVVGGLLGVFAAAAAPGEISGQPFAPKSGPRGATLFKVLPAQETGVHALNAFDDPTMWWERYREFSLGAIGTGVAIGDFDGDGRPDILVVCKTGPNRLFRNLGGFRFEDVTARAGLPTTPNPAGVWNNGVAFADINNDGKLDLYVCRYGAPNLLYVNQGDGTFREEAQARGLALNDASGMAAFCDYDRDGWLDVYVQTNLLDGERRPFGQPDHLFHNNRDGTFTDVTEKSGVSGDTQGHAATWWDYDEDGWPDLYVDNDFKDPDQLYHNNGDGTFTNVLSYAVPHTSHSSMGADLGDLNNDGHVDVVVLDMAATSRYKDHRGMARQRAGLTDNEERPHAAVQLMRNALFLNSGTGVMMEAACLAGLPATDWTWSVRLEDFDNDGRIDAFFTNGMVRELHSTDITNQMMSKESMAERIRIMKASPVLKERNLAYRNLGDLRFEEVGAAWGLDQTGVSFGTAVGDLDGDGDLDLVYVNLDGDVTVCRNDSDHGHSVIFALQGTASNRFGVGATIHLETASGPQVRTLTLARGYDSTSEPVLHFGLGDEVAIRSVKVEWPSGRVQTFAGLAADQRYTLVEPRDAPIVRPDAPPAPQFTAITNASHLDAPNHERPLATEPQQPLAPFRFNRPGPAAVVANLDNDYEDDLAIGGVAGEGGQLFSNLGGGQFLSYNRSIFDDRAAVADGPVLAIDADGDGDLDLLVTKAGVAAPAESTDYQPRFLLNDGSGRFTPGPDLLLPALPISVGAACAADFERSGRVGIFLGGRLVPGEYPKPPLSALLAWRQDRYVDVTDEIAPGLRRAGMVTAALWSDVDGDGWIDLLVAYDWGRVECWRNLDGKRFENVTDKLGFGSAGTGWWCSLAAADFNGDGKPDYVAGNVGLNTTYRASAEEPAVLYGGVVVDGSAPQLVEAQAEHGVWYPLRPREAMLHAFPSLTRRFPTADSYAKAKLEDVIPAASLSAATKLSVTELQSGVFLSQPDGTYRFTPLPRLAQIAPIYGMAAGDFDGDGRADLVVVGNSYAPPPETGRFDGGIGWLLRGDGHGHFTPVLARESGIVVRHDAKALAVIDFDGDGWPDFFVTRNNDRNVAFQNRALPGRHSFGVALRGKPGNPAAIGARLTVTLSNGTTQTSEVTAGSGYFSQSTATLFFGFPDDASPRSLHIRWPDGRETNQIFPAPPAKILRLSAP